MMTKYLFTILTALILTMPMTAMAGELEPTAAPDNATSAMYTLEDIYTYLDTGVAFSKRTGGFTEPASAPGPTGYTLDDIHGKIAEKCITCEGTLNGTRWCDNGDGTVKDMTTGLVWLKNANCFGAKKWIDSSTWDDAQTSSGTLSTGTCDLTDGSVEGDWRLPTKEELHGVANGTEPVRAGSMRAFTGVQSSRYWSSTTDAYSTSSAWYVDMSSGGASSLFNKGFSIYVWPVRSDN